MVISVDGEQTGFVGMSALYLASQEGHAAVCEALISARCEVDHVTKEGASCLYIAVSFDGVPFVQCFDWAADLPIPVPVPTTTPVVFLISRSC